MNRSDTENRRLAEELMEGCPEDLLDDHETIADAISADLPGDDILDLPEMESYSDTYVWIKDRLSDID